MLVPGVLKGSDGALFYPAEEVARNPQDWNAMPIVVYHPTANGLPISARHPDVLEKSEVGRVFNSASPDKLAAEGWFDEDDTKRVDIRVYNALDKGIPMELSTGLYLDKERATAGAVHNGTPYDFVARNYRPDHLAVLPDQRGACSVRDGCGLNVNQSGSLPMPTLTDTQRKETVEYLTSNCDCWKHPGDPAILNAMSDERLAMWKDHADREKAAKAAPPPTPAPVQPVVNAAPAPPAPVPVAAPVDNATRLSAEEQEDLAFARAERLRQKQAMIDRLTANYADPGAKAAAASVYQAMKPEQLAPLLAGVPQPQQQPGHAAPSYFGAAPPPATNAKDDSDNLLPVVTLNFEEMASPKLRKQA